MKGGSYNLGILSTAAHGNLGATEMVLDEARGPHEAVNGHSEPQGQGVEAEEVAFMGHKESIIAIEEGISNELDYVIGAEWCLPANELQQTEDRTDDNPNTGDTQDTVQDPPVGCRTTGDEAEVLLGCFRNVHLPPDFWEMLTTNATHQYVE